MIVQSNIGFRGLTGFGVRGDAGMSAYQIAVANGFIGTEADWLASLTGDVGPEGPQGDTGPQGPQGPQGATGDDGLSAYEVAVSEGFSGTEAEWLASLSQSPELDARMRMVFFGRIASDAMSIPMGKSFLPLLPIYTDTTRVRYSDGVLYALEASDHAAVRTVIAAPRPTLLVAELANVYALTNRWAAGGNASTGSVGLDRAAVPWSLDLMQYGEDALPLWPAGNPAIGIVPPGLQVDNRSGAAIQTTETAVYNQFPLTLTIFMGDVT